MDHEYLLKTLPPECLSKNFPRRIYVHSEDLKFENPIVSSLPEKGPILVSRRVLLSYVDSNKSKKRNNGKLWNLI